MWRKKERKKKRKSGGEGVFILFPVAEGQEGTGGRVLTNREGTHEQRHMERAFVESSMDKIR